MASFSNFKSTAMQCGSYNPKMNTFSNSTEGSTSCLNCKNFNNNHCKLDLYDKINGTE